MVSRISDYEKIVAVVGTKHAVKVARLSALAAQMTRIDADLSELRRSTVAGQGDHLQALGVRAAWAWRKEAELQKLRSYVLAEVQNAKAQAARTFAEQSAAEKTLQAKKRARAKHRERRAEHDALSAGITPARRDR